MSNLTSLNQFFQQSGLMHRCFDVGRHITPISNAHFSQFESLSLPWARPYQQHAWIGILMWNPENNEQHSIWFLKLPLDEQNLLIPAARDYLLNRILAALVEKKRGAEILQDNPFAFAPNQEKRAAFTATCKQTLGLPMDHHLANQVYLQGQSEIWAQLSLQQVADFCTTLTSKQQIQLASQVNDLTDEVIIWLTSQLEHSEIEFKLAHAFIAKAQQQPQLWPAILRGLSHSKATGFIAEAILTMELSQFDYLEDLILVLISRATAHLQHDALRLFCLNTAHQLFNDANFNTLIRDLLTQPELAKLARSDLKTLPEISARINRLAQQEVH